MAARCMMYYANIVLPAACKTANVQNFATAFYCFYRKGVNFEEGVIFMEGKVII